MSRRGDGLCLGGSSRSFQRSGSKPRNTSPGGGRGSAASRFTRTDGAAGKNRCQEDWDAAPRFPPRSPSRGADGVLHVSTTQRSGRANPATALLSLQAQHDLPLRPRLVFNVITTSTLTYLQTSNYTPSCSLPLVNARAARTSSNAQTRPAAAGSPLQPTPPERTGPGPGSLPFQRHFADAVVR